MATVLVPADAAAQKDPAKPKTAETKPKPTKPKGIEKKPAKPTPEPKPEPPPEPAPPEPKAPEPVVAPPPPPPPSPRAPEPPPEATRSLREDPAKAYYFLGLRYRGNVIPGAFLNLFVREGKTLFSNHVAIEFERRKDGFSIVPALGFTEYGSGDFLVADKTRDLNFAGNWTVINSSLKSVVLQVDLLWSKDISDSLAFEYGAGVGVGILFGDLRLNWLRDDPQGALVASTGQRFTPCKSVQDGVGCALADHENATVAKVDGYVEKTWFGGGSVPAVMPWISIPQIGLRYRPIPEVQTRLGVGFGLTGVWFGLSGSYGFPVSSGTASKREATE
ncbi:MAG: hypothetical protein U0169_11405 [Polyangiaceae bacterium]